MAKAKKKGKKEKQFFVSYCAYTNRATRTYRWATLTQIKSWIPEGDYFRDLRVHQVDKGKKVNVNVTITGIK